MKLKTLILEDDKELAKIINNKITNYSDHFDPILFHDLASCLDYIKSHSTDIAFLDIEIQDKLSIDLANELKKPKYSTFIVFISNYPKYAIECIGYRVLNFIEKKDIDTKLIQTLEELSTLFELESERLTIPFGKSTISLSYKNILYISKEPNNVVIQTERHEYKYRTTLLSIEENLPSYFIKVDQGVLVNFFHIQEYKKDYLIMSNKKRINISRRKRNECFNLYHQLCIKYMEIL